MKAYVSSFGEKTTELCCSQLERFGFEVVLMDEKEEWHKKYKRFIQIANEDCLRIDADVIVNEKIKQLGVGLSKRVWIESFTLYDLYRNGLFQGSPIYYKTEALDFLKKNLDRITPLRPEASALRLKGINEHKYQNDIIVVGMHGFFQDDETVKRAKSNKEQRGQTGFEFDLVNKLRNL